jgi:hypothetical protein
MGRPPLSSENATALFHAPAGRNRHVLLALPCLLQRLVDAEAGWLLARREFLECLEELADDGLGRSQQKGAVGHPLVVEHAPVFVAPLEGIAP